MGTLSSLEDKRPTLNELWVNKKAEWVMTLVAKPEDLSSALYSRGRGET